MKIKTTKYIIISESIVGSWLKDIFSCVTLFGLFYLNYRFINGNIFFSIMIIIFFIGTVMISTSTTTRFLTLDETIKFLEKRKEQL